MGKHVRILIFFLILFLLVGFVFLSVSQIQESKNTITHAKNELKKMVMFTLRKDQNGSVYVSDAEVRDGYTSQVLPSGATHVLRQIQLGRVRNQAYFSFKSVTHADGLTEIKAVPSVPYLAGVSYIVIDLKSKISSNLVLNSAITQQIQQMVRTPQITALNFQTSVITRKKVWVLEFNPILESHGNVRLNQYFGWFDPSSLEQDYIQGMYTGSGGYLGYEIISRQLIDDFPVKLDGFYYTDDSYLACQRSGGSQCHNPDGVNFLKILNDFNICEKRNAGEIDELWVWGAPWFGMFESGIAGPNGFWYNSNPIVGSTCGRQLPIMAFSYQDGYANMFHNFGHRAESVLKHLYGSWEQLDTHAWNRFSLLNYGSNYGLAGCGNIHYPPNTFPPRDDGYIYNNQSVDPSRCDDWYTYPNLTGLVKPTDCSAWGCMDGLFFKWWQKHLPRYGGIAPDGKKNNWWSYIIDYEDSVSCSLPPTPPSLMIGLPLNNNVTISWSMVPEATSYHIRVDNIANGRVNCAVPEPGDACYLNVGTFTDGYMRYSIPMPSFPNTSKISVESSNSCGQSAPVEVIYVPPFSTPTPSPYLSMQVINNVGSPVIVPELAGTAPYGTYGIWFDPSYPKLSNASSFTFPMTFADPAFNKGGSIRLSLDQQVIGVTAVPTANPSVSSAGYHIFINQCFVNVRDTWCAPPYYNTPWYTYQWTNDWTTGGRSVTFVVVTTTPSPIPLPTSTPAPTQPSSVCSSPLVCMLPTTCGSQGIVYGKSCPTTGYACCDTSIPIPTKVAPPTPTRTPTPLPTATPIPYCAPLGAGCRGEGYDPGCCSTICSAGQCDTYVPPPECGWGQTNPHFLQSTGCTAVSGCGTSDPSCLDSMGN